MTECTARGVVDNWNAKTSRWPLHFNMNLQLPSQAINAENILRGNSFIRANIHGNQSSPRWQQQGLTAAAQRRIKRWRVRMNFTGSIPNSASPEAFSRDNSLFKNRKILKLNKCFSKVGILGGTLGSLTHNKWFDWFLVKLEFLDGQ